MLQPQARQYVEAANELITGLEGIVIRVRLPINAFSSSPFLRAKIPYIIITEVFVADRSENLFQVNALFRIKAHSTIGAGVSRYRCRNVLRHRLCRLVHFRRCFFKRISIGYLIAAYLRRRFSTGQ